MPGLLISLSLLAAPPVLAQDPVAPAPYVIQAQGGHLVVSTPGTGWTPGVVVAVYLSDPRPDPRTGQLSPGMRYGGDARIVWVGPDLIELSLHHPDRIASGTRIRLGDPLGAMPTPAWVPPPPPARAAVTPESPPRALPTPPADATAVGFEGFGHALGRVQDSRPERPQALALTGGFSGDGYDTGAGWGALTWSVVPPSGPGRVAVSLEGLRGQRWVESKGDEPDATEPAVGYWLLTRVDSPGVDLAVFGVLGAGVDEVGPDLALGAGLRTGHPDGTRLELSWDGRGRMGHRFTLDGRVALQDGLRVGVRARSGTLPVHQGEFLQWRADGALVVDARIGERWALTGAVGAGGYDLPWRDLGLVADGRVEVRW